jgi:hypothetical protein
MDKWLSLFNRDVTIQNPIASGIFIKKLNFKTTKSIFCIPCTCTTIDLNGFDITQKEKFAAEIMATM